MNLEKAAELWSAKYTLYCGECKRFRHPKKPLLTTKSDGHYYASGVCPICEGVLHLDVVNDAILGSLFLLAA